MTCASTALASGYEPLVTTTGPPPPSGASHAWTVPEEAIRRRSGNRLGRHVVPSGPSGDDVIRNDYRTEKAGSSVPGTARQPYLILEN